MGFLSSSTDEQDVKPFTGPGFDLNTYANNGAQDGSRAHQEALFNQLQIQANGGGPSVATAMYNQAAQQNAASANALAAGQRGVNTGLAMRQALQSNASANQNMAAQAAIARQQEQLNAQGLMGQTAGQMRAGDIQNTHNYNDLNTKYAAINAGVAQGNTQGKNALWGSVLNSAGGAGAAALGAAHGAIIPGEANVPGDDPANDTVHTMLSPGEIVIPRTKASNPEMAKEFIDHLMSNKKKPKEEAGFGKVLEASRALTSALQALQKKGGK